MEVSWFNIEEKEKTGFRGRDATAHHAFHSFGRDATAHHAFHSFDGAPD